MNEQASRLIELRRLSESGKKNSSSKIVSVCSGKGGTGKTFFSANFAYQLSLLGKRVLLVDLDLNFSNLNILLNETSTKTISNFFEQSDSLEEIIVNYSKNLDLIFGDSGRSDFPRVSRELIDYLFFAFQKIQSNYDLIILDSSSGADELVLQQLNKSDCVIILTSPEPTAVMDAYVTTKLLVEAGNESEKFVVINKSDGEENGLTAFGNLSIAVKHFLQIELELLGMIIFEKAVYKSVMNQELLLNSDSQSNAAKNIFDISRNFFKITQVANNNQPL
jgi:flagellar biosynthesis protein FlhG